MRKVHIVYYLSHGGGLLEHPHLLEVSTSSAGLFLRDVKTRLSSLRGNLMPSYFSWSYKRSYKQGYVWHDLESDDDPIFPTHDGSEYVLIGCKIESSCIVQTLASPSKTLPNATVSINKIPTLMQPVAQLPSSEDANKNMAGSSHVCGDNIMGIREGSEHLHVDQESDPDYEAYAESQASTSQDHSNAMEQSNLFSHILYVKGECAFKKSSLEEHVLKGKIDPNCGSEFTVITKAGCSRTSYNSSQYGIVADAATQTGEDDEPPMQTGPSTYTNLSHYELSCPPIQAAGSVASTSRKGMFSTHRVITENVLMELSREEISPPPCSTSFSTIASSARSASSSNTVLSLGYPEPSLDRSTCLGEDQILQEKNSLLCASGDESAYNAYFAKPTSTVMNGSTYGDCNHDDPVYRAMFCISEDSNPESDSSNIRPHHAMSICSSSGRFLHLVSCNGGLDVINPIRRNSSIGHKEHAGSCEEPLASAGLLLRNAKNATACMHRSGLANISSDSVNLNDAHEVDPSLPYVTSNVLSGRCLSLANRDDDTASSFQEASSSAKKLWHLKGWVDSQYKKIKSLKGGIKGSSTTSATI